MNDKQLEKQIIQALESLDQGQSIEQILRTFPGSEEDLRPALETTVMFDSLRVAHTNKAQTQSRNRFLAQAETLKEAPKATKSAVNLWRRLVYPLAFLTTVLLVLGLGTILASQSALPGDVLYGPKLTFEGVRLSVVRDLQEQELLQQQFEVERVREIRALITNGRQAEVVLNGTIESISENEWVVQGIPVLISDNTIIDGLPDVGVEVQIKGQTNINILEAEEVIAAAVEQPAPEPTVTPAVSEPTEEGRPEKTPDGESLPGNLPDPGDLTPTITPSGTPSPTATTTPSATPSTSPTATPFLDNDNDNNSDPGTDNDNDNDNNSGFGSSNGNDNSGSGSSNDNDNDNNSGSGSSNDNDNDNNSGSGSSNDNDNDNDNNSGSGSSNDNDNDNNSGSGSSNDNDNDNDNNSGSGSSNDNDNDNDNNSGSGSSNDN